MMDIPFTLIRVSFDMCLSDFIETCDFKEVIELNLSNDFLRNVADKGFTIRFNSKRKSNKIKVSKAYLMGYLKVAQ